MDLKSRIYSTNLPLYFSIKALLLRSNKRNLINSTI